MKDNQTATKNKKKLIEALELSYGIVTTACKSVKVSRQTFYQYCKLDPEFKKDVDSIQDIALDFVEGQLLKSIKNDNVASIIYYMKTKGRKRGYAESSLNEDQDKDNARKSTVTLVL